MSNSWDDMKKAKEEEFFARQNAEALKRLSAKPHPERISPVSGKPMEIVTAHGINFDRCRDTGGVFVEKDELAEMYRMHKDGEWIEGLLAKLLGQEPF